MSDHAPMDDAGRGESEVTLTEAQAAFAARAGRVLRTAEPSRRDLADRVMREIRSDALPGRPAAVARRRSWWSEPRSLTFSPLGGLALAAGFAGIVALGALGLSGQLGVLGVPSFRGADIVSARSDTVHLVRFVFVDPAATHVALAGDFNGWSTEASPLTATAVEGVWSLTLPMTPGRYEYAFVVDGDRWVADPLARRVADEFGGESSVLRVEGGGSRTM